MKGVLTDTCTCKGYNITDSGTTCIDYNKFQAKSSIFKKSLSYQMAQQKIFLTNLSPIILERQM